MTDFSHIPSRHEEINLRLERWGRWIVHQPNTGRTHPMFAQYRSKAWQWEAPVLIITGTPAENYQIEKLVSGLPDKHRTAIRWAYAFAWVPVTAVRRALGVTRVELGALLNDGRDMVINRMRADRSRISHD